MGIFLLKKNSYEFELFVQTAGMIFFSYLTDFSYRYFPLKIVFREEPGWLNQLGSWIT